MKHNDNIYKIGMTRKSIESRVANYPKGSLLYLVLGCIHQDTIKILETELIKQFSKKYKQRTDIGTEYFEGNIIQMINDIVNKVTT